MLSYCSTDMATVLKNYGFILSEKSDFRIVSSTLSFTHAFIDIPSSK